MAEAAKERGNALYKSGKFSDAVAAYDEAIAADASIASVHANRAAALSGQGRAFFAEAVRSCVTAVALDPSYARARSRLGQLCTKLGELDTATTAAEDLARADPDSAAAKALTRLLRALRDGRNEGNAAFKSGDHARAKESYTAGIAKAAESDPDRDTNDEDAEQTTTTSSSSETLARRMPCALLLCNRAACSSALGDHASALADAEAALNADPTYVKAMLRRAHALEATGRLDEALAAFSTILRAELPGDPAVADGVNRCARAAGKASDERAGPVHVTDGAQYSQTVAAAKLCVVDFTASWCGPCRQIAPAFERMALANPTVHFLKVDVDEVQDVAARENVRSMPTFKLYRYGSKVEEFSGADPNRLQAWLTRYLPTVA